MPRRCNSSLWQRHLHRLYLFIPGNDAQWKLYYWVYWAVVVCNRSSTGSARQRRRVQETQLDRRQVERWRHQVRGLSHHLALHRRPSAFLPRCMECRRGLSMSILSVSLSVYLSVRQTHGLWQNGSKICSDFIPSFVRKKWLVGDSFHRKFCVNRLPLMQ